MLKYFSQTADNNFGSENVKLNKILRKQYKNYIHVY